MGAALFHRPHHFIAHRPPPRILGQESKNSRMQEKNSGREDTQDRRTDFASSIFRSGYGPELFCFKNDYRHSNNAYVGL